MKSSKNVDFSSLQARLEKIELQNKRLRIFLLALLCSTVALFAMGAKMGMKDGYFHRITAGQISIVDSSGKEIIGIGSLEGQGTGIRILNKAGKRVIGIGITADEQGSGMLVADQDGTPRLGLGMDKEVPSIAMTNENGKKILGLGGDASGYGLVVMDGNEVERAGIGFKEGSTGIVIYDAEGRYVRGMVQRADGTHFSSYVDSSGTEVYSK